MRRRALLAALPASLSLSGCLDALGRTPKDGTGEATATDARTPTPGRTTRATTTDPRTDVSVRDVTLQYGLVRYGSDSIRVASTGRAFLYADVAAAAPLDRDAIELRVDGATYTPVAPEDRRVYRTAFGPDSWFEGDRGLVLFSPSRAGLDGDPPDVRLTWPGGEHAVSGTVPQRLARGSPSFDAALEVPEEASADERPGVTVVATNEGDAPARFLGGVNRNGPRVAYTIVQRVSALVDPGETVRLDVADQWAGRPPDDEVADGESDVVYRLDWGDGYERSEIRLV